jgi:hypothetical protein
MRSNRFLWIGLAALGLAALVLISLTLLLVPQETNPAFAAALAFANAAGKGDDETAFALLSADLQTYVQASCPDSSVSGCIRSYTPPEWGDFLSVVFRRAAPAGDEWNVDLIATYAEDKGFSGVCIYTRLAQQDGAWRVTRWAGYVSCGDPASRGMASNPAAPNRAP